MFAETLRKTRRQADLTQKEMAEMLNMTQAGYSKWEKGLSTPNADKLKQVANILNVPLEYLLDNNPQIINTNGNNNQITTKTDNSQFKNNSGSIDINFSDSNRSSEEITDDKNVISLLEEILEQQKLLIDILKNR